MKQEIQELIPDTHQELIEAVPRGFPQSILISGLFIGAFLGALLTYLVPAWLAGTLVGVLGLGHWIYKSRSDKFFERRMAELKSRGLDWKADVEV